MEIWRTSSEAPHRARFRPAAYTRGMTPAPRPHSTGISPRAEACSIISRATGEPLEGTAPTTTGYVVIENGGPWARKILSDPILTGADGGTFDIADLASRLDPLGATVLYARRPGSGHGVPSPFTVVVAALTPDGGRAASRTVSSPADLAPADLPGVLTALRAGTVPAGWEPLTEAYLACTHGMRDACCAELGRPVAQAFADAAGPDPVWEVSHVGGHRLAANVLLLPDGLHLGRVAPADAADIVGEVRAGRITTSRLRGRSALAPSVQAAEIAVRAATGVDGLDAVRLAGVQAGALDDVNNPPDHGPLTISRWRVGAERWTCTVLTVAPRGEPVPESCGADPVAPRPRQLVREVRRLP